MRIIIFRVLNIRKSKEINNKSGKWGQVHHLTPLLNWEGTILDFIKITRNAAQRKTNIKNTKPNDATFPTCTVNLSPTAPLKQ